MPCDQACTDWARPLFVFCDREIAGNETCLHRPNQSEYWLDLIWMARSIVVMLFLRLDPLNDRIRDPRAACDVDPREVLRGISSTPRVLHRAQLRSPCD